jgi:hypothetical protein
MFQSDKPKPEKPRYGAPVAGLACVVISVIAFAF